MFNDPLMKAPQNASAVCKMVLDAMPAAISFFVWRIGDGQRVRFAEDNWLGVLALCCWPTFINMQSNWPDCVAECITVNDDWDKEAISIWAGVALIDKILHLPRARDSVEDVLL